VNKAKNEAKDYTDQVTGDLDTNIQQAITDAITAARRDFWEEENPPGTVRFFAQNIDPNEKWPWSQWTYTGENKTIRVGKADGSNVGATGGSDTVTLKQANLPAVQIDVSGETSEQKEQKLTTTRGGVHNQWWQVKMTRGKLAAMRQLFNPKELGVTDDAGEHDHEVTIPPHKHSTNGKTANLGEGNRSAWWSHTLLMCWARVA
jgi:hypothetical protein